MALELTIFLDPVKGAGLSVVARVYALNLSAQLGADVPMIESPVRGGGYVTDFPTSITAPGSYRVDFFTGATHLGSSVVDWDGTREVTPLLLSQQLAANQTTILSAIAALPTASQIATTTEAALLNEGDGQQLIDGILQVFNTNLDLPSLELTAIAQATRAELAPELARLDTTVSSRLADADYAEPTADATAANQTTILSEIAQVRADVAAVASAQFDPDTDTVARVTLVDTVTVNTDMRGTDNALPAATYASPEVVADALLGRSIAGGANGGRTVTQALRANRNRVNLETGAVYEEDDVTVSHTYGVARKNLLNISEVTPS